MATVHVMPGICGFEAQIVSSARDVTSVTLEITSDCPRICQLASELPEVSALTEIGLPITETSTYKAAARCSVHGACAVPSAIAKAIEVAAGLALPADVHFHIERE